MAIESLKNKIYLVFLLIGDKGHVKKGFTVDAMSYMSCLGSVISFACDLH